MESKPSEVKAPEQSMTQAEPSDPMQLKLGQQRTHGLDKIEP